MRVGLSALGIILGMIAPPAMAVPFFFTTGNPDGKMASASRPGTGVRSKLKPATTLS